MTRMQQIRLPSDSVVMDEGNKPRLQVQRDAGGGQETVVVRNLPLQWDSRGYMCELPAPALGNAWLRRLLRRPVEQVQREASGGRTRYERHRRERADLGFNMASISGIAVATAVGKISNLYKWSTCDELQTGLAQRQCGVDGWLAVAAVVFAGGAAIGSGMRAIVAFQSKVLDDSYRDAGLEPGGTTARLEDQVLDDSYRDAELEPGGTTARLEDVEEGGEAPERPAAARALAVRKHWLPDESIVRVDERTRLEIRRRTVTGRDDEVTVLHDMPLKRKPHGGQFFCEIPKRTLRESVVSLFQHPVSSIRGDVSVGQLQAARRRQESTDLALSMASISGIAISIGVGAISNLYKWTTCGEMQGHMAQSQCTVDGWTGGLVPILLAGAAAVSSAARAVIAWQTKILDETERPGGSAGGAG